MQGHTPTKSTDALIHTLWGMDMWARLEKHCHLLGSISVGAILAKQSYRQVVSSARGPHMCLVEHRDCN